MELVDGLKYKTQWTLKKYNQDIDEFVKRPWWKFWEKKKTSADFQSAFKPYSVAEIDGNIMLNSGIDEIWDLVCGTGSPTAFDTANAKLGVGDSATGESAAQTGLQAATNKLYKAVDGGYPTTSAQQAVFQATFGGTDANYAWNEFCVNNGATNESTGVRMNRKVSAQGTKTAGQTWILTLTLTLS